MRATPLHALDGLAVLSHAVSLSELDRAVVLSRLLPNSWCPIAAAHTIVVGMNDMFAQRVIRSRTDLMTSTYVNNIRSKLIHTLLVSGLNTDKSILITTDEFFVLCEQISRAVPDYNKHGLPAELWLHLLIDPPLMVLPKTCYLDDSTFPMPHNIVYGKTNTPAIPGDLLFRNTQASFHARHRELVVVGDWRRLEWDSAIQSLAGSKEVLNIYRATLTPLFHINQPQLINHILLFF